MWSLLAARLRPITYIRLAVTLIAGCYLLVFLAMFKTGLLEIVIVPVAICSLVGNMVLALGYLGEDGVEVSEVGAPFSYAGNPRTGSSSCSTFSRCLWHSLMGNTIWCWRCDR